MPPTQSGDDNGLADALPAFLRSKAKRDADGDPTGNYARNLETNNEEFIEWLAARRDVREWDDLTALDLRAYAQYLRDERGIAASTARTYYANVAAFCGWAVREGLLDRNPARTNRAEEELPEDDGQRKSDQQFWSPEDRTRLVRHADERAHAAIDADGSDALLEVRDRALVYVLAYTGVRGAEVLRDPEDSRREGLRWGDVDREGRAITVLSKRQDWTERALPERTHPSLDRLERVLSPPSDDWPVFPTAHRPSLFDAVREELAEREWSEQEIETALDERDIWDLLREEDVAPPALTTVSGRRVLKRLCDDLDLDLPDDRHGYLVPHGGRRGAGATVARSKGLEEAGQLLDHADLATTREFYNDIEAGETATEVEDAFEESDG